MSKRTQTIIASLSLLGLAVLFGCASVQDVVTPCWVSEPAAEYAEQETKSIMPFTTLFDAKRIDFAMDYRHLLNQSVDKMKYTYLKGINKVHMMAAQEFQTAIFSPEGPIGLLFPTLLGGSLGALLIKRPGDKSEKELKKENDK